jgi:drug/metabolite transporter (DMT)-like permease
MALLAGLGFGCFFTTLAQVSDSSVFWPLASGRLVACALMAVYLLSRRRPLIPQHAPLGLLLLAGALDEAGNLLFLLATQIGRLDVSAVLSSLYPAVTALLAVWIARERMVRLQVLGILVAFTAIVLITS